MSRLWRILLPLAAASVIPVCRAGLSPTTISSLSPTTIAAGTPGFTLTITGQNIVQCFSAAPCIRVNWQMVGGGTTSLILPSSVDPQGIQVTAVIPAQLLVTPGLVNVSVTAAGGTSNTLQLAIVAPTLRGVTPSSTIAGTPGITLTLTGSGFSPCDSPCTLVQWQQGTVSTSLSPATLTDTQLTVNVPAALLTIPGLATISVSANSVRSNSVSFAVNAPPPTIGSINPSTVFAGGPSFTLTVNGTSFNSSSVVNLNGAPLATTLVSTQQLTATVPASAIVSAGTALVTVVNPGIPPSNAVSLTVAPARPVITSISPSQVNAGAPAFSLTVNGTSFNSSSVVNLNGAPLATSAVNAQQLTATVPASAIAAPGSASITVLNAGSVASNAATLTIGPPVPVITTISPNPAIAGGPAFTLAVNGTGFLQNSVVQLNSTALPTTFSNGQLLATVPASAIASPGSASITVLNAGSGASNAATLSIAAPTPVITSITPNLIIAGGPTFTLTINGTGFLTTASTVRVNGSIVPSTVLSPTQMTASITANLIAASGTATVTVLNFGETASNTVQLSINGPQITSISPPVAVINSPALTLIVLGTNFLPGSVVILNGAPLATTFVSSGQLTAIIPANSFSDPVNATINVQNSPTAISQPITLRVVGPAPTLAQLQPNAATVGGAAFTMNVIGTGFVAPGSGAGFSGAGSVLNWNGSPLPTTFLSSTQLSVSVPASLIAQQGTATVMVTNPDQTQSNSLTFTINPKSPVITGLSPSSAVAGSPAFTLTVNGTGFINGANVVWNNAVLPTTFVSATQVTAAVPANLIANAGIATVIVVDQGLPASNSLPFTITAGNSPSITSLTPPAIAPGGADLSLQVTGSGFLPGSVVQWNGMPLATSFVDASHLTATVPAALTASGSQATVTVLNPGGLVSNGVSFLVRALTTITSLNPTTTAPGGPAFTLTVNGSGFTQSSTVVWNGTSLATTFVSTTQLQAAVTADLIANVGTATVTVGAPDGPVSNGLPFQITAALPAITSLSPASINAAGPDFTLTIDGSGFTPGSVARWNGTALATTIVSATRLTATVPASLVAAPGTALITVVNGAGTVSNATSFSITLPPAPAVNFAGPATSGPLQQPKLDLSIANSYPFPITGRVDLTFQPDAVAPADDATIQFATGGRTFNFTIAPNTTTVPTPLLQTGTVAGIITLHPTLTTVGATIPVSDVTIRISRAAPVIRSVQLNRTSAGLEVVIIGYSTPRDVTQALFHFNGAATDVTVPVSTVFSTYYQSAPSAQFGSQFTFTQPFTVQGDGTAFTSVTVTLTNSAGSSAPVTSN